MCLLNISNVQPMLLYCVIVFYSKCSFVRLYYICKLDILYQISDDIQTMSIQKLLSSKMNFKYSSTNDITHIEALRLHSLRKLFLLVSCPIFARKKIWSSEFPLKSASILFLLVFLPDNLNHCLHVSQNITMVLISFCQNVARFKT